MNDLSPLSALVADDLLLDRLAARADAGSDPLAALLGGLAVRADTPLPARAGRRRRGARHRYVGAFAALAVAASGAGVAAAVTVPSHGPGHTGPARVVTRAAGGARSRIPSATPAPVGLAHTSHDTQAQSLVLTRRDGGAIVLVRAALGPAPRPLGAGAPGASGAPGAPGAPGASPTGRTERDRTGGGSQAGGVHGGGSQKGTPPPTSRGRQLAPGSRTSPPTPTTPPGTGTRGAVPGVSDHGGTAPAGEQPTP